MNYDTVKALKEAADKWENKTRIPDGGVFTLQPEDCPLCVMFRISRDPDHKYCVGCPVAEATGRPHCSRTPYKEVVTRAELHLGLAGGRLMSPEVRPHVQAEADFLRSLLPAGHRGARRTLLLTNE